MNKCIDESIPHVTARHWDPAPDLSGRGGAGEGETGTNQHSMLVCLPGGGALGGGLRILPAGAPALPASEARRQKPCMPASRSEGTRRARWGRGREAAGEGGEGRWSTRGRGRVRWTEGSDGQTERWKNGKGEKTMKETPPPKKRHS